MELEAAGGMTPLLPNARLSGMIARFLDRAAADAAKEDARAL